MWASGPVMLFSFSSSSKKINWVFTSWMLRSEKGQNFPPGARWLEREGRGKYLLNLSMRSYSIFLINICLDIIWGKPAQTTAMWEIPLLFSSCQLLVWRWRGKEERPRQRERVREFASNLKKVTGFCLDLAEDGMSWASQCTYGPCDGSKRLNSSAFLADIQETLVALKEKIISL